MLEHIFAIIWDGCLLVAFLLVFVGLTALLLAGALAALPYLALFILASAVALGFW